MLCYRREQKERHEYECVYCYVRGSLKANKVRKRLQLYINRNSFKPHIITYKPYNTHSYHPVYIMHIKQYTIYNNNTVYAIKQIHNA